MANQSPRTSAHNTLPTTTDIARLLADDAVVPMRCATEAFDILAGVLSAIADLADNPDYPATALANIVSVAKCAKYQADEYVSYLDAVREAFEGQHVPAILAAVQGGDHE